VTVPGGILASRGRPSTVLMPAVAASRWRSGLWLSRLCVERLPSGARAIMSVKVPLRSIQNCQTIPLASPGAVIAASLTREGMRSCRGWRGKYRVMRRYPIENLCSAYVYEQIVFRDLMR
jgi:hypothetical protein